MAEHDLITPETWKPIPNYLGYEVSDLGRVRTFWKQESRLPGTGKGYVSFIGSEPKVLKPRLNGRGYLRLNIRHESGAIRTVAVHKAVLWAFAGECPPGMVACHFPDPDRTNNRADNLRWDTQKENLRDAARHGTRKHNLPEDLAVIRQMAEEGCTLKEIAERIGMRPGSIDRIIKKEGLPPAKPWKPEPSFSQEEIEEMIRLNLSGVTHKEIGRRLGVSRPTITRWIKRING